MTFSGHASIAVITLKIIPDPLAIVILNLLLHPILDAVPHAEWSTFRESKYRMVLFTLGDVFVGLIVIWVALNMLSVSPLLVLVTLLAGFWLDILDPVAKKYLKGLRRFHEYLHTWPEPPDDPVDWGKTVTGKTKIWIKVTIQTLMIILALYIIYI